MKGPVNAGVLAWRAMTWAMSRSHGGRADQKRRLQGAHGAGARRARTTPRLVHAAGFCYPGRSMANPNVGDTAPDFEVADTDGQKHKLSEMVTRGPVILAFFPKAFTPG